MDPVQAFRERFGWLAYTEHATRKMIELCPESKWDFRPAPGSRTLGELVAHLYGDEFATLRAFQRGTMSEAEHKADGTATVNSRAEAIACMQRAHHLRDDVLAKLSPAQLERDCALFYGTFKGAKVLGFVYDEHWHHRGQLTVYLRCLGIAPPFLYGE